MMITIENTSHSEEDTIRFAATLAQRLRPGDVITLSGELGAGKTRFVRGLARGLNLNEAAVSSPTFVIVHEYDRQANGARAALPLIHIDAYRLTGGEDDLATIGWAETLESGHAVIAVEWPERIAASLPADRIDVTIEHGAGAGPDPGANEHLRLIRVTPRGAAEKRLT